jgi:VWFA-related protein
MTTGNYRSSGFLTRRALPFLVTCLLPLFPGLGNAQEQQATGTQPAPDKNAAEMSSHEAPATFKAKVNLVLVPVVVRDTQGRAVGNFKQEDFLLFDKGKPQVITRFSIEKSGGQSAGRENGAASTAAPGQETSLTMPERYVAYLFDDVHLAFGDLARVREAAGRHLASMNAADRAAIFTTSGQTMLDFTDNRPKFQDTLLRLQPRPITGSGMADCPNLTYYMADLIQNKNDTQAFQVATDEAMSCLGLDPTQRGALQMAQQSVRSAAPRALNNGDHETRVSMNVIRDAARRLSSKPGQRSIILVSPGFFTPSDVLQDKTDIIDRALRSNVVINALDARGLYTVVPGGDASQASSYNGVASSGLITQYQMDDARMRADVLAELADGTGGTFFHNSNDLNEGFNRVDARPEYLYMLGFSPQNLKLDGSFHSLKVTLKSPNKITLQARRGYYAPKRPDDPAETAKEEIQEALFSRELMHDLPVELHTQFFKASEDSAKVTVLVRLDIKHMRFRKTEGRNQDHLTIVSGLFDRNGNYVTAIEKKLDMRLKDETLEKKAGAGVTVRTSFDVKPGSYLVRLVVRDDEGQLMSTENGAVEIP